MAVVHSIKYVIAVLVFVATMSIAPAMRSEEFKPSTDFKNGLVVGQAVEAKWSASLCIELLAGWDDDEEKFTDKESVVAHLFHSAEVIHPAVILPDGALPEKMRASLEESLTIISDQLHKTTPERMDASKYIEGRTAQIEWLRENIKDKEKRKTLLAIYDRQIETVKMLVKYRSAPQSNNKTENNGGE